MSTEIIKSDKNLEVSPNYNQFQDYLKSNGLPYESIIVEDKDRDTVIFSMNNILDDIPNDKKLNAVYISRFVAASSIGLFDAALNYVWNEVVINLRKKVINYGLGRFYDNALGGNKRDMYKNENDLIGISDRLLLDTMHKLEWISTVIYKKLIHILDMRNMIGASHPNSSNIGPYDLLSWFSTCVKDVINEKPTESAVVANNIINNIKEEDLELTDEKLMSMENHIKDMSSPLSDSLLVTLFGIFVDEKTSTKVRENVLKLSKVLWEYSSDDVRYELGAKKGYYNVSLLSKKESLAETFLEQCNGLAYLSKNEKNTKLFMLLDDLINVNCSYNNFYNEPYYAKEIMKYIKSSDDIGKEIEKKSIETFLKCRIGREVDYCNGVSLGAKDYYDEFFSLLSKEQVITLLKILKEYTKSLNQYSPIIMSNIRDILLIIKSESLGDRLNEIIEYLITACDNKNIYSLCEQNDFKDISNGII